MNKLIILLILFSMGAPHPRFHSVTWREVVTFMVNDHTNFHQYTPEYGCEAFARDLELAAWSKGIPMYRVRVDFEGVVPHIFNAVDTSDIGTVYLEPSADYRFMPPAVGGYMCALSSGMCWVFTGMKIKQITIFDRPTIFDKP